MNWTVLDILLPNARRRVRAAREGIERAVVRARSGPRRTLVLAGVAAALLIVLLVVALRSSSGSDVPTNEFMHFFCPNCNRHFELNHRQFKRLWDKHEYKAGTAQSPLRFKCTYCGQLTAVRDERSVSVPQPEARTP